MKILRSNMFNYRIDAIKDIEKLAKTGYLAKEKISYSKSFLGNKNTPKLYYFNEKSFQSCLLISNADGKIVFRFKAELLSSYSQLQDLEFGNNSDDANYAYYIEFSKEDSGKTIIAPKDIEVYITQKKTWVNLLEYANQYDS